MFHSRNLNQDLAEPWLSNCSGPCWALLHRQNPRPRSRLSFSFFHSQRVLPVSGWSWCHTPHHCFLWLTFVSCLFIVLPLQLDCKHLAFLERLKLYYFFYSPCLVHGRTQGIQTGEFQFALSCLSKHVLLWGRESSEVALFPSKLAIGRLGLNK